MLKVGWGSLPNAVIRKINAFSDPVICLQDTRGHCCLDKPTFSMISLSGFSSQHKTEGCHFACVFVCVLPRRVQMCERVQYSGSKWKSVIS